MELHHSIKDLGFLLVGEYASRLALECRCAGGLSLCYLVVRSENLASLLKRVESRHVGPEAPLPLRDPLVGAARNALESSRIIGLSFAPLSCQLLGELDRHLTRDHLTRVVHLPHASKDLGFLLWREWSIGLGLARCQLLLLLSSFVFIFL